MAQQTSFDPAQGGASQFTGGLIRPGAPQFTPQSLQGSVPQSPSAGPQAAPQQPAQLQQMPRGQPRGPRGAGAHAQHRAMPAQPPFNPYSQQQQMMYNPIQQQHLYAQPQVTTMQGYNQYNTTYLQPYPQQRVPVQPQPQQRTSAVPREKKILEIQDPTTGEVLNSKLGEKKPTSSPGQSPASASAPALAASTGSQLFKPPAPPATDLASPSAAANPVLVSSEPVPVPAQVPLAPGSSGTQSGQSSAYVSPIFGAIANGITTEYLPPAAPDLDLGQAAAVQEVEPAAEGGDAHEGPIMFGDFCGVGSDEEEPSKKEEKASAEDAQKAVAKEQAQCEAEAKKQQEAEAKLKEEQKAKKESEEKAKKEAEKKAKKEAEEKAKKEKEEAEAAAAAEKAAAEEKARLEAEAAAAKEKAEQEKAAAAAKKKSEEEAKKTVKKSKARKAALEKANSAPAEDGLLDAFTDKGKNIATPTKQTKEQIETQAQKSGLDPPQLLTSDSGPLSWEDAPATPKVPLPSQPSLRPGGKKDQVAAAKPEVQEGKAVYPRSVLFKIRADLGETDKPDGLIAFNIEKTDAGGGGPNFRPGGRGGGRQRNQYHQGGQQNNMQAGGGWDRRQQPQYPDAVRGGGFQGGRGGRGYDQGGRGQRGGRGRGRHTNQPQVPEFTGPVEPLKMTENRWKPQVGKTSSKLDETKKVVRGILNKMTREKFERLSKQLIEIRMTSSEMLNTVIGLVFDKALDEPNFGDMYADLCVQLHGNSRCWSFVKGIFNEDSNQWYWTADIPIEDEAIGPMGSIDDCIRVATEGGMERVPCPPNLEIDSLRIRDKMFIKVMQCIEDRTFYTVFMSEDEAREQYHISPECFTSEQDALRHAQRKTAFKRFLLNKCQEEFEKENIYEDLQKQEKNFDWNSLKTEAEKNAKKEDFEEKRFIIKKRMLGNIRFIGELYKKDMLKENIMHDCLNHLLKINEDKEKGKKKIVIPDEEDLEALGKLIVTIGKKIDHPKSRDHMDSYINKMLRIKAHKSVSARTRFMIQDVVDQRNNNWVPRRKEAKAKTINEIRKEAAREMGPPQMSGRGRGGGRGPPGGPGGRGGMGGQQIRKQATIPPYMQQQMPGGGRGGGPPQNNMPPMMPQGGRGWGAPPPRGSPMMNNRNIGGGRLQSSQSMPAPYMQQRGTPRGSGRNTPQRRMSGVDTPPPMPQRRDFEMDGEVISRKVKVMADEYLVNKDNEELLACLEELPAPRGCIRCVDIVVSRICDGPDSERDNLVKMLVTLFRAQRLIPSDFEGGMVEIIEFLKDTAIDVPQVRSNLGQALGPFLLENCVNVQWVLETASRFEAGVQEIICAALDSMLKHASPEIACNFCRAQQLRPSSFCSSEEEAFQLIERKNYWGIFPQMKARQMSSLIQSRADTQQCLDWMASNADSERTTMPFMQELMEMILQSSSDNQEKPTMFIEMLKQACFSLKTQIGILTGVQNHRTAQRLTTGYVHDMFEFLLDNQVVSVTAVENWIAEFARIDPAVVDAVERLLRS